jgi:rhamnosyltransferase subunit B
VARVVLATIGSLGDLHPFVAVGLALRARGHDVVLAVPEDHLAKVRAAGLRGAAVMPSFATIRDRIGMSDEAVVARILRDQAFLMEQVLMPSIGDSVRALEPLVDGADVLAASLFALGAPIVAEVRGVPLVNVVLQPMTLFSAYDPPRTPEFRVLRAEPGAVGRRWNALAIAALRAVLRRRYGGRIDAVRAAHGLPPSLDAPLVDGGRRAAATLCCWSPAFAPLPPDAPSRAEAVGFATFDSRTGAAEPLDPALAAFLDAGPRPVVFTLGSFAVAAPGRFYAEAAGAARRIGRRAVLLTGEGTPTRVEGDVFACGYAPHSLLFPRAAAVVHHGGAGTTGAALRAGRPQLVVPHMGDQYDNGDRVRRLGLGRVIVAGRFTAARAAEALAAVLGPRCRAEAERVGAIVAAEDGAARAAERIAQISAAAKPPFDCLQGRRSGQASRS